MRAASARDAELYRWLLTKHITPHLGGVPVAKITTEMVREWRAQLLGNGVSESIAAKAQKDSSPAVSCSEPGTRARTCQMSVLVCTSRRNPQLAGADDFEN